MALIGGFMGGYAILLRADFFANAQTANLIYLVYALLSRNTNEVLLRLLALLVYFLATMTYVFLRDKTSLPLKWCTLIIDFIAIITAGFIPLTVSSILSLLPVIFAMPFQWNVFPCSFGYTSSTIFSCNNTK